MTRGRTPAGLLLAGLLALILLTGCGGSSEVKPAAYVKSMCGALGNWRNTIQSAGVALQSSGASTAPRAVARLDYQRFVHSLVDATRHATEALRVAGTPAVAHGEQIAKRLTRAFDRATEGLVRASSQAKGLRIDTASDFALGVGAVNSEIRKALQQIAGASPGQSPELRRAAARDPHCQLLVG